MLAPCNCSKRECRWYVGIIQPDGTEMSETNFCGAFPEGIPEDIAYGDNLHEAIQDNQKKEYVYEKAEDWKFHWDALPEDDIKLWQLINEDKK